MYARSFRDVGRSHLGPVVKHDIKCKCHQSSECSASAAHRTRNMLCFDSGDHCHSAVLTGIPKREDGEGTVGFVARVAAQVTSPEVILPDIIQRG